jgi:hypothetical protein
MIKQPMGDTKRGKEDYFLDTYPTLPRVAFYPVALAKEQNVSLYLNG